MAPKSAIFSVICILVSCAFVTSSLASGVDFVSRRISNVVPSNAIPLGTVQGMDTFVGVATSYTKIAAAQIQPTSSLPSAFYVDADYIDVSYFLTYVTLLPDHSVAWVPVRGVALPSNAVNVAAEGEDPVNLGRVTIGSDTFIGQVSANRGGLHHLQGLDYEIPLGVATEYEVLTVKSNFPDGISFYVVRGPKDFPSNAITAGFDSDGSIQYVAPGYYIALQPGYHTVGQRWGYYYDEGPRVTSHFEVLTVDPGYTTAWVPATQLADASSVSVGWSNKGVGRTRHENLVDVVGTITDSGFVYNYQQRVYSSANYDVLVVSKI